ncbi:MAG TPA: hypothetical protein VNW99_02075 [Cytophagaceae bacterium]|jgi:hypothetical protein|nr:hypothetical protein [Cytophagaceae bacterium]
MAQLVLVVKKKDGTSSFQVLRPGRTTPSYKCTYVFFDYDTKHIDHDDEITFYAWNSESIYEVFMDDIKVQVLEPKY